MRKPAFSNLLSRCAWIVAGWWHEARFVWHTTGKRPLVLVTIFGLGLTAFGALIHAVTASRTKANELTCLALNIYYEARGEPLAGQYAVAEVTMNRVASPYYPDTVCEVVYQKNWDPLRGRYVGAFSWTERDERAVPQGEQWQLAKRIAEEVYSGRHRPVLHGALHYHATYVRPGWSRERQYLARIGRHVFYR